MYYTISIMSDCTGTQSLNHDKVGNEYKVGIRNKDTSTYKHRKFATIEEAEAKFLYLARCIIRGEYSFEDRVKILEA